MAFPLTDEPLAPPASTAGPSRTDELELQLLLDALRRGFEHDYGDYGHALLRRRVGERMRAERVSTITQLLDRVLHDDGAREKLILQLGGGRRALFGEPSFFRAFRSHVIPLLQTYAFVRIWLPAMGTGEDAYAMACLLHDAGLLGRCVVYATAAADELVARARRGTFPISSVTAFEASMQAAGIERPAGDFAQLRATRVTFDEEIRRSVMFARHDVARDASINEFHAIVVRGAIPLYNGEAQYRVHRLLYDSLARFGFLCLGGGESIAGTVHEGGYRKVVDDQAIYRRMR